MSYAIIIDPMVNCVFIKFGGTHVDGIREKSLEDTINNPNFKMGMNFWQDVRDQPFPSDTSYKYLKEKSNLAREKYDALIGKCRWATIVSDAEEYARVHQFVVTGRLRPDLVERKPFRDIIKAREWLGIPEDYEIEFPPIV